MFVFTGNSSESVLRQQQATNKPNGQSSTRAWSWNWLTLHSGKFIRYVCVYMVGTVFNYNAITACLKTYRRLISFHYYVCFWGKLWILSFVGEFNGDEATYSHEDKDDRVSKGFLNIFITMVRETLFGLLSLLT